MKMHMHPFFRQWSPAIWKLYLYEFFKSLHFFGAILIPFYTEWGHLSFEQIFLLQAWFMFWVFILEVPTGTFADRFGRRTSLAIGAFLTAGATFIYVYKPEFVYFLIAELIWALSVAFISGADDALIYDTLKSEKKEKLSKKAFSWNESIGLIGIAVGSTLGSIAAKSFGITFPYLLSAATLVLAGVIALTIREPRTHSSTKKPAFFTIMREGLGYLRTHKTLRLLVFDMVSISAIAYFMIWLFQPLLTNAGVGIEYFGLVHAGIVVAEVALLALYPYIEKKLVKKKRLLFQTSLFTGVFFILAGITTFLPLLLAGIILGGGVGLTRKPILSSYMQKYIPSERRATIGSGINMIRTLTIVVANLIVGKLAEWSIQNTMVILGVTAILFALISRVEEEHLID